VYAASPPAAAGAAPPAPAAEHVNAAAPAAAARVDARRLAALRPRTVWDVLDDAFDLYRDRFALLAGLSAVTYVPAYLLSAAIQAGPYTRWQNAQNVPGAGTDSFNALFAFLAAYSITLPLMSAAQVFQSGAVSAVVQERLLGLDAVSSVASVWRRALRRFPALLGAALLVALASTAAACASLGVGIVFVTAAMAFVGPAIVLEGRGVRDAFRRSWALAGFSYGRVLGLVCLLLLVNQGLAGGVGLLVEMLYEILPKPDPGETAARELQQFVAGQALTSVVGLLLAPLEGIGLILLYYDCRVRREGLDMEAAAVGKGIELAPDYFGGVAGAGAVGLGLLPEGAAAAAQQSAAPDVPAAGGVPGAGRP